jgi:hypothetical protein
MRIPVLLFGLVVSIGVLLVLVALLGDVAPQVAPHADHPSLLRGTDGAARAAPVWWAGAVFGALQIAFFGACFALGVQRRGSLGPLLRPLCAGLLVYGAVYALLLFCYRSYLADPSAGLMLGFPPPTAVMLYGLWPVPLWFLWLYLRHFDDWILREEDLERVRRMAQGDEDDVA